MFDPDHRNQAVRRVCENAGCVFLGEHEMVNRRMALYALNRSR
jgi:RimJ/RimL family protein N-acetyltransferase